MQRGNGVAENATSHAERAAAPEGGGKDLSRLRSHALILSAIDVQYRSLHPARLIGA